MKSIVNPGETISDVVINATGTINNWDKILSENLFTSWVPELTVGQEIDIPSDSKIDRAILFKLIPCCNNKHDNLLDSIKSTLNAIVINQELGKSDYQFIERTELSYYQVNPGETISDVVINSTGTLNNWDKILTENEILDWSIRLDSGQLIIVPTTIESQKNVLFKDVQCCNNLNSIILDKINVFTNIVKNTLILGTEEGGIIVTEDTGEEIQLNL